MQISDSSITLESTHSLQEEFSKSESLTLWKDGGEVRNVDGHIPDDISEIINTLETQPDTISLSNEGVRRSAIVQQDIILEENFINDLNLRILRAMIERLTGNKTEESDIKVDQTGNKNIITDYSDHRENSNQQIQENRGYGLVYTLQETYTEEEKTTFSAEGFFVTSKNEKINFSVDLLMSREFVEQNNLSIRAGEALKDPLVINHSGNSAELTEKKYKFDIDADGIAEQISFVTGESGFLALDKNNDGKVNDGAELFGPITDNGFAELALYDQDKNGWIDENDAVYQSLKIWSKSNDGSDQLSSLEKKGVGAIYLDNVSTSFEIRNRENNLQGKIQSTSVFAGDDMHLGTIQQIDLMT